MNWLLIFGVIISFYMAFTIAANDIGNSVGTAVGSGALKMRRALILGAATMFIGAIYLGGNVTRTIRNGIIGSDALTTTGAFNYYISCCYLDQFYFTTKDSYFRVG